jgi:hypothetical protein
MAKYTAMLIKNDEEHFQTYDTVVKSTPMCDINPLFTDYKISRFSTLRSPASEQGVEAMRKYDWQLFIPPTNKFTVITGPQRYSYIELLNLNAHDRKMTFRVSDFAGQRIRWSMRSWAEYELSFQPKTPNRTLPMNIKYLGASSYEHILSHTKEAKFSKEETAFWYALFGLEEMTDPAIIVVKLPPHDNHPDGAKLGITVCNAKSDIAIIQKIQGITIVNVDRSLGQDAFKENVMKDEIVRYLQLIAMINSELIDNTADIRKAGQTGTTITSPGGFIFSFPSPTQIRGGTA